MMCASKEQSLQQFIAHFNRHRHREGDPFYFGEEIEYMLIKLDSKNKMADVFPNSLAVLEKLWQNPVQRIIWKSEFGSYMIESSPEKPYHALTTAPLEIEENMKKRRREVKLYLSDKEHLLTIASFPRLGDVKNIDSTNIHPDDLITKLPRYQNYKAYVFRTVQNGVEIKVPVFRENIATCLTEQQDIVMNSVTYGYGCCCLQVTMQAPNLQACMQLYDQLVNIAPVMMEAKYGVNECGRLNRSESVHCYVCPENQHLNDTDVDYDKHAFQKISEQDCSPGLALYIANLLNRTPLPLASDTDDIHLKHYLNIQSTNWQTVRIKVPTEASGWTVEFRPMDVQVTDFENTAYVVFMMLLAKVILEFKLTLAVPISKVNENIEKASLVNAIKKEMFYMPTNLFTENTLKRCQKFADIFRLDENSDICKTEVEEKNKPKEKQFNFYCLEEIIAGGKGFVGLLPIIRHYLTSNNLTGYDKYLQLIEDRARGTIPTTACAIRDFVLSHPHYHHDSKVNERVQYDLIQTIARHTVGNTVMGYEISRHFVNERRSIWCPDPPTKATKMLFKTYK